MIDFYQRRRQQERWQRHSAKEREALAELELAIKRFLTQASPGNVNNAAFMDAALPHVEKIKQALADAKPRRLSMMKNTLEFMAQYADPAERVYWEIFHLLAISTWLNRI